MKKIALSIVVLSTYLLFQCYGIVNAQIFVSATGNDSHSCAATAPCLSFHQAISSESPGLEINCLGSALDESAAATNITKTITIDCHGASGTYLVAVGSNNGFVINAPGDVVTLRGLNIDGTNGPGAGGPFGLNAVVIQAAAIVNIEDCVIENFAQSGISVTTAANTVLNIKNTTIRTSANGISFAPTGGSVNGSIDHATIVKMSGDGITGTGAVYFTVTNSVISNAAGVGVNAGAGAVLEVDSSSVSNSRTGFATSGGIIRISRNVIYDNTANYSISGGTIATSGDNKVSVNGSTVPNGTITQQ
ncbi:MAG TPA: right-handed parallel beta-helix repeat-containing protein [Xanthobacteraceae bacterium]